MKRNLFPVQHLGPMPFGYSKPQLIAFNDGMKYVVKFKNNPTGTRVLVNEYVAASLAQLLGIPIAPFYIVPISDSFFRESSFHGKHHFQPGQQFASLYIENCSLLISDFVKREGLRIMNREALAGMLVFDLWLSNTDRKEKNVLLQPCGEDVFKLYLIDHGRCFANSNWTPDTLQNVSMNLELSVHKWGFSLLKGREELIPHMEKAASVSDTVIYNILDSIPEDWEISTSDKEALYAYLLKAQRELPTIVDEFIKKTGSAE